MNATIKSISTQELNKEFGLGAAGGSNNTKEERTCYDSAQTDQTPLCSPGNVVDSDPYGTEYKTLDYLSPALMLAIHNKALREQTILLHPWQLELLEELGTSCKTAHSKKPYKLALCAANGSGKDAFIVAPFAVWFAITNIRALVLITSSSGVQLTAQTELYIRSLCESINSYYGTSVFLIRQRYIKCLLTGAEIRLFATDEPGRAEGYHPLEANAKMCIIVNEAKSVSEEIMEALRRCTGYSHWINVSTPGAPKASFYRSFVNWSNTRCIDYRLCPHLSDTERLDDLKADGENSAYYRSKWLALFTSLDSRCIIPLEIINELLSNPPDSIGSDWPDRIGIDLAAGGDECGICQTKGNKIIKEFFFRERDTTISTDRLEEYLLKAKIPKTHEHIYADDGGVGRAIIDSLVRRGWNIKRILNQSRAILPKQYGNRGAELYDRVKRFFEERLFNPVGFSQKLIDQLTSRRYKSVTGGRIFLESKKDMKSDGLASPDRSDAFVLSLTGLNLDDFLGVEKEVEVSKNISFSNPDELAQFYEDNFRYGNANNKNVKHRVLNSLAVAMTNENN